MIQSSPRMLLTSAVVVSVLVPTTVNADDFGSSRKYYEKDAWWDVTEWFDGNDYNPTDEALLRWDDETYSAADNKNSGDRDSDGSVSRESGFKSGNASDWFYDFYDDLYGQWDNGIGRTYHDFDNDGFFDAMSVRSDNDGDGRFEDFDYYVFNDGSNAIRRNAAKFRQGLSNSDMNSTPTEIAGTVENVKFSKVRGQRRLVAKVAGTNGEDHIVDLGKASENTLEEGDKIKATGHILHVGDRSVLMATEATRGSDPITIDRRRKPYSGKIEKLKSVKARGVEFQMVKLRTDKNKTMLVDLGTRDRLKIDLQQGDDISVQGAPVRVDDRVVLMANEVVRDGETVRIIRN